MPAQITQMYFINNCLVRRWTVVNSFGSSGSATPFALNCFGKGNKQIHFFPFSVILSYTRSCVFFYDFCALCASDQKCFRFSLEHKTLLLPDQLCVSVYLCVCVCIYVSAVCLLPWCLRQWLCPTLGLINNHV